MAADDESDVFCLFGKLRRTEKEQQKGKTKHQMFGFILTMFMGVSNLKTQTGSIPADSCHKSGNINSQQGMKNQRQNLFDNDYI